MNRVGVFLLLIWASAHLGIPASFLHAVPPQFEPPKPLNFVVPKAKHFELSNKAGVYFLEDQELPQIQLTIMLPIGSIYDPADKAGLSSLFASVLPYGGTKKTSADVLTKELELMGSSIRAGASEESFSINLFCLSKNFSKTLELLSQIVREPMMDAGKLETEKKKLIAAIHRRNDEPRQIVNREFRRMIYGPDSPWGRRIEIRTIQNVSRRDLMDYQRKYLMPNHAIVTVSGAISEADLIARLEAALGRNVWAQGAWDAPEVKDADISGPERTVYLVAKTATEQSAIRLGHYGVERHHPDYFKLKVLDELLGGGFSSRLFRNVRSRKGLAYGVWSNFSTPRVKGLLMAGVGTKSETTVEAIEEVLKEIQMFKQYPVTQEELLIAKSQIIYSFLQNFRASHQIAEQVGQLELLGYPRDYLDTYTANIDKVTAQDILSMATHYWSPEKAVILVVGNPKKFDRDLSTLGPVKILDAESGQVSEPPKNAQGSKSAGQ